MFSAPHRSSVRRITLLMAGVLAITLGGLAQAMETKAVSLSSGGAPGSFAVAPDSQAIALFSLESPLATSPEARAFIQARLEEWELEKASVLTLACQIGGHYGAQFRMLRSDLRFEEKSATRSHSLEEDLIQTRGYRALTRFDSRHFRQAALFALPELDARIDSQIRENALISELVGSIMYDDVSFAGLGRLPQTDRYSDIMDICDKFLAIFAGKDAGESQSSGIVQKIKQVASLGQITHELNGFLIDWLRQKSLRLDADLRYLEANQHTPARIALPASALPPLEELRELEAAEAGEDLSAPEASGPVAEAKVEAESKASVGTAPVPAPGGAGPKPPAPGTPPSRTFDEYYRFVDCSRQPRRVTDTLQVSRSVARIREEVEYRSMELTSGKLVRLVKALAPYGAKCEPTRKNGIMVKLPTGRTDMPFIAKLFHRSHAAHDSFDCNSVEAAKELFDGSIFSVDKFR